MCFVCVALQTKFPGCKCAQEYEYTNSKGVTEQYSGSCTMSDWPFAWCATVNCGIKAEGSSISTGYWADCKPFGTRAALETELLMSGEECTNKQIDACEIEALRPLAYRCDANTATKSEMLNPLPASCTAEALANKTAANWAQVSASGQDSFRHLRGVAQS
jgi:hypothetical protein